MRNAAIEKIVGAYMSDKETEFNDEIALVADTLDSHGWMHVNDVVDGVKACTYKGQCNFKKGIICHELNRRSKSLCEEGRPATVQDLIRTNPELVKS